jgi:dTDP-4-dehydrorhamnose reductase
VHDQIDAPTIPIALADSKRMVMDRMLGEESGVAPELAGIYFATTAGSVSWSELARDLYAGGGFAGKRVPVVGPIASRDYLLAVKRPANSVFSNGKLRNRLGIALPHLETALDGSWSACAPRDRAAAFSLRVTGKRTDTAFAHPCVGDDERRCALLELSSRE